MKKAAIPPLFCLVHVLLIVLQHRQFSLNRPVMRPLNGTSARERLAGFQALSADSFLIWRFFPLLLVKKADAAQQGAGKHRRR